MTKDNIFLGTSGWSYAEWEGVFYEKGEKTVGFEYVCTMSDKQIYRKRK